MRNVLNVIVDILTLLAVTVAAIGHVLPWFEYNRFGQGVPQGDWVARINTLHAALSGGALAILAMLVFLSLNLNWGPMSRRWLSVAMFISAFAAILIQVLVITRFEAVVAFRAPMAPGFVMSLTASCFAAFFSLLRMTWTMLPARSAVPSLSPAYEATPRRSEPRDVEPLALSPDLKPINEPPPLPPKPADGIREM